MVLADRDDSLTELVFLHRAPLVLRGAVVVLIAVGVGIAGVLLADAHVTLAARSDVASLNPVQRLLRSGSSAVTAWPGWVGAAFFALSLLRLRRGPLEPAAGLRSVERLSAGELRSGLRAEYRAARWLLCAVLLIAAIDVSRTIATAYDVASGLVAATVLVPTAFEAAGYAVAALVLAVWARRFALDVHRLGALG